jgi:hypothetical protein
MSFLSEIETIGKDIVAGIEKAKPLVGEIPAVGPIITEIADVVTAIENKGSITITSAQISEIVQAVSLVTALKTPSAAPPVVTPRDWRLQAGTTKS